MLNWIWLFMVASSVIAAALSGTLAEVTAAVLEKSKSSVMDVMLPMAGMITLWMGLMRLVERSGLILVIARAISPVMGFIFPDIPKGHPALGSIAMNLGAGMLGAGNAATPMGLRAMKQLASLNPNPGVATNAMCMLLALCTSGITLIPAGTIALLSAANAKSPTAVIVPSIFTTLVATASAIAACMLLQKLRVFRIEPLPPDELPKEEESAEDDYTLATGRSMRGWRAGVMSLYALLLVAAGVWYAVAPDSLAEMQRAVFAFLTNDKAPEKIPAALAAYDPSGWVRLLNYVSWAAIPAVMGFFVLYAALAGLRVFEELVEGAKEGMGVTLRVIPYVVAMLAAIGMFSASGALGLLERLLRPLLNFVGFPVEVLPIAIVRPLSGGAANGVLGGIVTQYGPDSLYAQIAATINASSETTFYVAAVYFGSIGIKRMRHAIAAGLIADAVSILCAVFFCTWLLG